MEVGGTADVPVDGDVGAGAVVSPDSVTAMVYAARMASSLGVGSPLLKSQKLFTFAGTVHVSPVQAVHSPLVVVVVVS